MEGRKDVFSTNAEAIGYLYAKIVTSTLTSHHIKVLTKAEW